MRVANGFRARLLGLAFRRRAAEPLLIPRCRSVHTFGMRFAIDVVFLDAGGRVLRVVKRVPPCRIVSCRGARAVVEIPAGERDRSCAPGQAGCFAKAGIITPRMAEDPRQRFLAGLNPAVPLYRDTYNELFVFVLSAGGAAAGTQVPLYLVMALTERWSLPVFVIACVIFELGVIFGIARPQMKPSERVGWAALWSAATAVMAVCFYYLVAKPTL
jgi:uncharacterized membrane protein (UPF0127 family)